MREAETDKGTRARVSRCSCDLSGMTEGETSGMKGRKEEKGKEEGVATKKEKGEKENLQ